MADVKGSVIGTGILAAGVLVGSFIPKDASEEAQKIASDLTGIPQAAIIDAVSEERVSTLKEIPATWVKLPVDTVTKKQDSVLRSVETIWTTTVNEGFWINWPDTKRMPLTTIDSYETDTGAVIIKNEFKPSDSLIEACKGVAVQRIITYKCIPLYGTITR